METPRKKLYWLYIDESGDHTYRCLETPARRYLCLAGVFVENDNYHTFFDPALTALKRKHFEQGPDKPPVVLKRSKIINKEGPFEVLKEEQREQHFNSDLLLFLGQQDYKLIAVVLDKKVHLDRYGETALHPYHYCLSAILVRYCEFLDFYNAQGEVLAEARGKQDRLLARAYSSLYDTGTFFFEASFFQRVLRSRELKIKDSSANIAGLQVADQLAHPVKQEILMEKKVIFDCRATFGKSVCRAIWPKYHRQIRGERLEGYGKIFLG